MAEQAEATEKRYAILIASSSYPKEPGLKDLRCPENDVDALDAVLRSPDFGGFAETFVFKNRPSHEVLEKIETVLGEAGRHDLVLIYFSGHGKLNPAGQLCLATANTKLRALGSTSIPAGSIKSYFDHSASRKKILLLDCCYSGAVGKDFIRGGVDDQLQLVSRGQGTFIMTASTGIEVAVEKEGDRYGLFTKHLVQGIRSGEADTNEDGFVDMQELYEYVHEKVQGEGAQKPMQWGLGVKGSMIIARSGRVAKEKRQQELRAKLYELAAQGLLSDGIVSAAVNVISLPDKEMTAKDRECLLLIEQLVDERISAGDFVESWVKSCLTPEPPPPPRLKLLLLILVAVSCAVAGAGWYFFREPPPVSVELPKMGTVSVSLRTLPSLSQIKLQPLSPLSSPSEQTDIPDKTEVAQEEEQVVEKQFATISVSPPVVPSPKEEPAQPFIIVDHPRKKKVVVNTGQTPTEESVTELVTDGMELASDPKMLQGQKGRTVGQYIDHGDGTITDTKTGLMWKRCLEGLSGDNCEDGEAKDYTWDELVKRFKNVEYADWRLPTLDELKTLVYCSKGKDKEGDCKDGSERPMINQQVFPNTERTCVWSGSPFAANSDYAWYVEFNLGLSEVITRDYFYLAVRLVRGGQSSIKLQPLPKAEKLPQKDKIIGQYIDHGDGTITDTKTGLMWKRCSEGLSGDNCENGEIEKYKWDDAVKRFKNVEYAGSTDWRLPTIDELKTLVYCSNGTPQQDAWDRGCNKDYSSDGFEKPTINRRAFPNTEAGWYRSGSPNARLDGVWSVFFGYGNYGVGSRSYYDCAVRLVRGMSK